MSDLRLVSVKFQAQAERFNEAMRRAGFSVRVFGLHLDRLKWRQRSTHFALPWHIRMWARYRAWCLTREIRRLTG